MASTKPIPPFEITEKNVAQTHVLDLLGGVVRTRPLSGEEALERLDELERKALEGDPVAQASFARYLLTHDVCARNNRRAVRILKKSLETGLPEAAYLWGLLLMLGQGVTADHTAALGFWEEAALKGHVDAQRDLARAYKLGIGTEPDLKKALYWFRLAGAAGSCRSQREAGLLYRDGAEGGVPRFEEAGKWLGMAAQGGDMIAQYELARLLVRRDHPSPDPAGAEKWMREAALSGEINAQYRLGIKFWAGQGQRVDLREALRWTCRAAEGGDTRALVTLAGFFQTGNALPVDRFKAYVLLKSAAKRGDPTARAGLPGIESMLTFREKRAAQKVVRRFSDVKTLVEEMIPRAAR